MNYYDILQISNKATEDDIKKAYQELVRKYHPDKSQNVETNEEFLRIDKAYKVLKDKELRKRYDSEMFQKSNPHLIIHDTVSRSQFSCKEDIYCIQCKCGSDYMLDEDNFNCQEDVLLSCDECSLNILVKQ